MLKRYHYIVNGIFRMVDACVIGMTWMLCYPLRFYFSLLPVKKGFPSFHRYAALSPLVIILWMIVFSSSHLYQSRRILRRTQEILLILKTHILAMLLFVTLTYLFSEYKYSRGVILYFGIFGGFFLVFFRLLLRNTLRRMRKKGFNLRYVLLLGEGKAIETLINRIEKFPELGLRISGILTHHSSSLASISGKRVIGHFSEIKRLVEEMAPDQVLIALPRHQFEEVDTILNLLKTQTVDIQFIPDIHEYATLGCEIEDFDGLPIININHSPLAGWGFLVKRFSDILFSATALILFFPVFIILAILIKWSSQGSIFYKQERMGLDGVTFYMLKFRSMHENAEKASGAVWASAQDSRRTRLGAFLRRTSLDELPQFWNVLVGNMSLVGPRPERPIFIKKFKEEIPHYMLRHKVKAGMTGWAQVSGWRGNTSLDKRIECDLYYIRNWSFLFDLKILILTFWKGFMNKNAY